MQKKLRIIEANLGNIKTGLRIMKTLCFLLLIFVVFLISKLAGLT